MLGVADDHPGAGAEDRPSRLVVGAQRRLQAAGLDPLADRRALAAGDDQAVEPLQLLGGPHLDRFGAEPAQGAEVGFEAPLER